MDSEMDTSSQIDSSFNTTLSTSQRPAAKGSKKVASNYFDIDDILALSERVPCKVKYDLMKMGYLDQSTDDEHLPKGTKLELPLWFAKEFYNKKNNFILLDIEPPQGFNETFRQIFDADASVVDLNKICFNFYKFGEHLVDLEFKESELICKMLESTFNQRIHYILNYSLNAKSEFVDDGIKFKKKLDNLELKLYNIGKKELNKFQKWEENQLNKIDTNDLVINLKKRKQAANHVGVFNKN